MGAVSRLTLQRLRIRWNAARTATDRLRTPRGVPRYRQPKTGWSAVWSAPFDWGRDWFTGRRFLWLLGVVFSAVIVWEAGIHLGPGLQAAHGQGIRGSWIAQDQKGGRWYGEFVSSSGTVTLSHVYYASTLPAVEPGSSVPALDSGASDEVYPLTGSGKWIHDVIGVVAGGLALLAFLARGFFVARRRRRARRTDVFSYGR